MNETVYMLMDIFIYVCTVDAVVVCKCLWIMYLYVQN
jgi:hypothetical protein